MRRNASVRAGVRRHQAHELVGSLILIHHKRAIESDFSLLVGLKLGHFVACLPRIQCRGVLIVLVCPVIPV